MTAPRTGFQDCRHLAHSNRHRAEHLVHEPHGTSASAMQSEAALDANAGSSAHRDTPLGAGPGGRAGGGGGWRQHWLSVRCA
jgi:hypothetical protein